MSFFFRIDSDDNQVTNLMKSAQDINRPPITRRPNQAIASATRIFREVALFDPAVGAI